MGPLLRFWKIDLSFLGVIDALAVTVPLFKISSGVCSLVVNAEWQGPSCHEGIILVGATHRAGWWRKRFLYMVAIQMRLVAKRGAFGKGTWHNRV